MTATASSALQPTLADRYGLDELTQSLAITADHDAFERLEQFVGLLLRWNRTYNLTAARDEATVVHEHLVDCLAVVPVLEDRISIDREQHPGAQPFFIDVGSGAGFPGLVIAALRPQWHIALVEPNSKKSAFLTQTVAALQLPRVRPIQLRVEAALPALRTFAAESSVSAPLLPWHFTCRAVASLERLVALAGPLAQPRSRLFAMKGPRPEPLDAGFQVTAHSQNLLDDGRQRVLLDVLLRPSPPVSPAPLPREV